MVVGAEFCVRTSSPAPVGVELWAEDAGALLDAGEEEEAPHVTVVVTVDHTADGGVGEVWRDWAATLWVMVEPQACDAGTW